MVIKVEELEEKTPALKEALPCLASAELKAPELQHWNVSKYYQNNSVREIVGKYFSADMALFGYKPLLYPEGRGKGKKKKKEKKKQKKHKPLRGDPAESYYYDKP